VEERHAYGALAVVAAREGRTDDAQRCALRYARAVLLDVRSRVAAGDAHADTVVVGGGVRAAAAAARGFRRAADFALSFAARERDDDAEHAVAKAACHAELLACVLSALCETVAQQDRAAPADEGTAGDWGEWRVALVSLLDALLQRTIAEAGEGAVLRALGMLLGEGDAPRATEIWRADAEAWRQAAEHVRPSFDARRAAHRGCGAAALVDVLGAGRACWDTAMDCTVAALRAQRGARALRENLMRVVGDEWLQVDRAWQEAMHRPTLIETLPEDGV
jgi:hypothetical protein